MQIVNRMLNKKDFDLYINEKAFGTVKPTSIILHHTWRPTVSEWQGQKSIDGLKTYYEGKGWNAGPHLFICQEGIWLFTDMYRVGIHASAGNATYVNKITGKEVKGFYGSEGNGTTLLRLKEYSIGIEMVGDYDVVKPSGAILDNTLFVIKTLMARLGIDNDHIFFHRDFDPKTCPGAAVTKEWLFQELANYGVDPAVNGVPVWAVPSTNWARSNNIINKFEGDAVTDYELAVVLKRFYDEFAK
jgi:hypothetical protein